MSSSHSNKFFKSRPLNDVEEEEEEEEEEEDVDSTLVGVGATRKDGLDQTEGT